MVFNLWQFEVFNSGAEGLVVVLCWFYLWEIFFLPALGFELGICGISSPALFHCTVVISSFHLWQFHVFNSCVEGLGVVIVMIGPVRDFHFACTGIWTGDLWISSPALFHCTMMTSGFNLWQFEVFNSGAEALVVSLCWFYLWEIFFLPAVKFELGISGFLVLHSTTCIMVTSGFHLWQFEVFNSGAEGLVVSLCWFYLWEIFFLPALEFELGISELQSCTLPLHHGDWWFWPLTIWGIKDRCRGVGGGIVLIGPVRDFSFCLQWGLNWGPLDL